MTFDGTNVELDELDNLTAKFRELSDSIRSEADKTTTTHHDSNMFGAFGWLVANELTAAVERTARGLYALSANVGVDAENVAESAVEFGDNEQAQVARFRSADNG